MIWADISGYEGFYQVSDTGLVKKIGRAMSGTNFNRKRSETILKPEIRRRYKSVTLSKNGIAKHYPVHRLVASTFLGDHSANNMEVNHKDGDKNNNCVENLEWVSRSDNAIHRVHTLGKFPTGWKSCCKPVEVDGKRYESISEASRATGICRRRLAGMYFNNIK